ncbi:hypothetical protein BREVNS_0444 [Brevinematales bacterium NS]|nr:TOMM precursor leader peptide-binding protein [Brevinematales bacterium]QJR21194.1 hypothetical protein BREVNS_0444 [Brevinematales bacterium NS]
MWYKKRPYAFVLEESPRSLFVDHMGNWFLLRGEVVEVVIKDLLGYLEEPRSLEDILQRFTSRVERKDLEDALSQLVRLGVIEEYEEQEKQIPEGLRHFFHLFTPYLEEKKAGNYYKRLVASSVMIIGEKRMGEAIRENLLSCGMEKVFFEEVSEAQNDRDSLREWLQQRVGKQDIIVVCGGEHSLGFFLVVNKIMLDIGLPALYVQEDWTGGILGPLVVSDETACFQCYLERKQANKEYDGGYELMKQQVGLKSSSTGFVPFRQWIVSVAVIEVIKFLSRYLYPETLKGVFLLDAVNYRLQFHPVLKSPYCSACGYVDRIPPQRVWVEDGHGV